MRKYLESLDKNLFNILSFWSRHLLSPETGIIFSECDVEGNPNKNSKLGSLFLSRILYGVSASCQHFNNRHYKKMADLAYKILSAKYRNPAGGFYWALTKNGEIEHDSENIMMAQAFVLFGLAEFAKLERTSMLETELEAHYGFIEGHLKDQTHGGYIDDVDVNWNTSKAPTKSLGTHIHLLEAYVNYFRLCPSASLEMNIRALIETIYKHFIDKEKWECLHRLTSDWQQLPNTNWAGHNAEVGWILVQASEALQDQKLIAAMSKITRQLTTKVLEQAYDITHGGIYNELIHGAPTEPEKYWWPSAETVLALLYCHKYFKNELFIDKASMLIEYIENTIQDKMRGEWYSVVSADGNPIGDEPKVHFWKSLYHNVRYCIEVQKLIREID